MTLQDQGIYLIINRVNGKFYVGQTTRTFRQRFNDHRRELIQGIHGNPHLQSSWNKHGEAAFYFEPLEVVRDCSQLTAIEQEYLDRWVGDRRCYNANPTSGSNLGRRWSPETRARMSEAHKGHPVSPEQRKKLSEARKGWQWSEEARARIAATKRGTTLSDEHKKNISAGLTGRKQSPEHIQARVNGRYKKAK